jgi:hypothetical protein
MDLFLAPQLANAFTSPAVTAIPNLYQLPHNCSMTICDKMGQMTNISFGPI